jgi:hypothetical protein
VVIIKEANAGDTIASGMWDMRALYKYVKENNWVS